MAFNDLNAHKSMPTPMLEENKNRCVRQMVFGGTSSGLGVAYVLFSKGTKAEKAAALGAALISVPSGFNHVEEYKTMRHELAERGVEPRLRKRDIVESAGASVATSLALLGAKRVAKGVAKSTGFL